MRLGQRAASPLTEALAIQRRALGSDDLRLAETMIALARAYLDKVTGLHSAVALLKEALRIQRLQLLPTDQAIVATEDRLAMLQSLATQIDERG